jgi:type-F conjugative transfer system secretin TraK
VAKHFIKTVLLLLISSHSFAAQQVRIEPGGVGMAKISATDPTRIRVAGGRIVRILGGEGKITGVPDEAAGDAYITPTLDYQNRPFSLFVKDEKGRVSRLLLTPVDGPAEEVVIVHNRFDGEVNINSSAAGDFDEAVRWETLDAYEATLVNLISHLATRRLPDGYAQVTPNRVIPLWKEAQTTLLVRYHGARLIGEIYEIVNRDEKTMRLTEQEFLRPSVRAVSLDALVIGPGEKTYLYIVSATEPLRDGGSP